MCTTASIVIGCAAVTADFTQRFHTENVRKVTHNLMLYASKMHNRIIEKHSNGLNRCLSVFEVLSFVPIPTNYNVNFEEYIYLPTLQSGLENSAVILQKRSQMVDLLNNSQNAGKCAAMVGTCHGHTVCHIKNSEDVFFTYDPLPGTYTVFETVDHFHNSLPGNEQLDITVISQRV
jgi:hypothetical protein